MIVDILFTDTDKLSIRAIEKEVAIKTAVKNITCIKNHILLYLHLDYTTIKIYRLLYL